VNDPAALRPILLGYTEKVIELEAKVTVTAPKVEVLDQMAAIGFSVRLPFPP